MEPLRSMSTTTSSSSDRPDSEIIDSFIKPYDPDSCSIKNAEELLKRLKIVLSRNSYKSFCRETFFFQKSTENISSLFPYREKMIELIDSTYREMDGWKTKGYLPKKISQIAVKTLLIFVSNCIKIFNEAKKLRKRVCRESNETNNYLTNFFGEKATICTGETVSKKKLVEVLDKIFRFYNNRKEDSKFKHNLNAIFTLLFNLSDIEALLKRIIPELSLNKYHILTQKIPGYLSSKNQKIFLELRTRWTPPRTIEDLTKFCQRKCQNRLTPNSALEIFDAIGHYCQARHYSKDTARRIGNLMTLIFKELNPKEARSLIHFGFQGKEKRKHYFQTSVAEYLPTKLKNCLIQKDEDDNDNDDIDEEMLDNQSTVGEKINNEDSASEAESKSQKNNQEIKPAEKKEKVFNPNIDLDAVYFLSNSIEPMSPPPPIDNNFNNDFWIESFFNNCNDHNDDGNSVTIGVKRKGHTITQNNTHIAKKAKLEHYKEMNVEVRS